MDPDRPASVLHGVIAGATLAVADLPRAERAWTGALGYTAQGEGVLDPALAASWAAPAEAGQPVRWLAPSSGADFTLRLVSSPRPAEVMPRRTYGWAALELTVRDADAMHARLVDDPDFEIIAAPAPLAGLDAIYPMQAAGPADEVVYLNEVRGDLEHVDLPRARCDVDHAFIVVLGTPDWARAERFYHQALGFERDSAYEIPYQVINQAFDLPSSQTHKLVTTRVGRRVNVEIDQYPATATARTTHPGRLPPALALVSFYVDDLDAVSAPFLAPPRRYDETPCRGRRTATVRGAAGELVELIEVGS